MALTLFDHIINNTAAANNLSEPIRVTAHNIKEVALLSLELKKEQFSAFYLIAHPVKANVLTISPEQYAYSLREFEEHMPYAFKMAGEMAHIQSQTLKPLRSLGDKLEDLVTYLEFQAKKIDLMMSYILQQQDEPKYQANASKFGGGGCVISQPTAGEIGSVNAIKLFLESESAAIYAFGEVIDVVKSAHGYDLSYVFTHIRAQDQELLVRASLHLQTQTLRAMHETKND